MAASFIDADTIAELNAIRADGFATEKAVGNTQTITFHRDNDDGSDLAIGPYAVLVELQTSGSPQGGAGQSISFVGVFGEFRKESPFAVKRGDRFCLNDGSCGSIATNPTTDAAFIRAPFVIER